MSSSPPTIAGGVVVEDTLLAIEPLLFRLACRQTASRRVRRTAAQLMFLLCEEDIDRLLSGQKDGASARTADADVSPLRRVQRAAHKLERSGARLGPVLEEFFLELRRSSSTVRSGPTPRRPGACVRVRRGRRGGGDGDEGGAGGARGAALPRGALRLGRAAGGGREAIVGGGSGALCSLILRSPKSASVMARKARARSRREKGSNRGGHRAVRRRWNRLWRRRWQGKRRRRRRRFRYSSA